MYSSEKGMMAKRKKIPKWVYVSVIVPIVLAIVAAGGPIVSALILGYFKPDSPDVVIYQGFVRDSVSMQPVSNARIMIMGRSDVLPALSDSNGNFASQIPNQGGSVPARIQILHEDYEPWDITRVVISNMGAEEILLQPASFSPGPDLTLVRPILAEFVGLIDGKYEIKMVIRMSSGVVSGNYMYTKHNIPIAITGTFDRDGAIVMNGFVEGEHVDEFVGRFDFDGSIAGTWTNPRNSDSMPFEVYETTLSESD